MTDYLKVCEQAAKAGGKILMEWYGKAQVREKGPADYVTEADVASQKRIREIVLEAFPDHQFLGEESEAHDYSGKGHWWVVDPLDGTTNYVHRLNHFCVSIALARDNQLVCGTIYDPVHDECFSAAVGQGATLNGMRLASSGTRDLGKALVAASFPPRAQPDSEHVSSFVRVLGVCHSVRRSGSSALNLAFVAAGRYDAYWASHVHSWDVAAGVLIAQEAGAKVTNMQGGEFDLRNPEFIAAASPELHIALQGMVGRSD